MAPLTAITAAVVGVIVNLAVFFAWRLFWLVGRRARRAAFQRATKLPDLPPCFSSRRTASIVIARSTALHMS